MYKKPEPLPDPMPRPAFLSDDPILILQFLLDAFNEGVGCGLVTLVSISGGSAKAIGAQMAVRADGLFCGYVSGGCVEAVVAREVMIAIKHGGDRLLHLGEGSPFFDIRLACGGAIRLAIHVLRDDKAVRSVLDCVSRRHSAALVYDARQQKLDAVIGQRQAVWREDGFVLPYSARLRVLLAGQPVALSAVSDVAIAAGYQVMVLPDRVQQTDMDCETAVVLLQHDIAQELPLLLLALESPAFYIGALGSARMHERRCAALKALGVDDASLERIHAPIGLFPKARDARSLALSIVADIAVTRSVVPTN